MEEVIEKIFSPLAEYYDTPFDALEDALIKGKKVLEECGIPEEYVDIVYKIAKENILIRKIRMRFTIEVGTLAPDGINRIKQAFRKALEEFEDISVKYESAPRYMVWVEGFERMVIRRKIAKFAEKLEEILMSMPDAKKYRTFVRIAEHR